MPAKYFGNYLLYPVFLVSSISLSLLLLLISLSMFEIDRLCPCLKKEKKRKVSFCCLCTFLTGISLSAISTNGAMKVDWECSNIFHAFVGTCMVFSAPVQVV